MLGFARTFLPSIQRRSRMSCARHVASLGVLETGEVSLDPELLAPVLERPSASQSQVRSLYLNRPKAMHALNLSMINRLHARLRILHADPGLECIVLESTGGRAFCAGGDIKWLHSAGSLEPIADFFRAEYSLNHTVATSPKRILSLWDGIVMGGGAGVSVHGRFRVATENAVFAMPECSIGLHPDVGASHFLSRLPGALGRYLGLTGARLRGREIRAAGLATHYIESQHLGALVQRLESVDVSSATAMEKVLSEFEEPLTELQVPNMDVINACFDKREVEDVVTALAQAEKDANDEGEESFARNAREMIAKGSPSSLKVTLESVTRGRSMSIAECLDMEFRLSVRCASKPNLIEGIRAAVVDRTKPAAWQPSSLEEVSKDDVLAYFAPLDTDSDVPELGLTSPLKKGNVGTEDAISGAQMQSRL